MAKTLESTDTLAKKLLAALDRAFIALDTRAPLGDALYASLPKAHQLLSDEIADAGEPLDVTLHGIGHAHMDIAYLWPVSQIRLKNARTYSNVLRLMEADPDFRFSHSQPQLYDYMRRDYPQLFEQIKQRVKEGRWEVMGGMWVEPDLNIPGGEALVRQLMLGRSFFEAQFGQVETPALWLPDTFGFPGQIPQLMRHAGLKWFVTNKLSWNQKNRIPSTSHIWEGIDGSQVIAHVLTTPRPVQYLPFPTNYKSDLSAPEVLGTWTSSSAPDAVRDLPICYGYGDGGGGPTEDLLAKARIFQAMPGMPRFQMSTVKQALERIEESVDRLPVWKGEHYLEGHRGTLTSQAWIKRANRKAEWALHNAEALCVIAGVQPDLKRAWELLCLNHFHDIITGTSVAEVFVDARKDYAEIEAIVKRCKNDAISALGSTDALVANLSPVGGPRLALLPDEIGGEGQVVEGGTLAFFSNLEPYSVVKIDAGHDQTKRPLLSVHLDAGTALLENQFVRARISANGNLIEFHDKVANRSVLADGAAGNVLQTFEDRPICWDAWDIDPFIEDRMECIDTPCQLEIVETGPLRACVRVTRRWRSSEIVQDIRLAAHSGRLDFATRVDWHETHTLLKAAFPTCIAAPRAQFDIQWGTMERGTARDSDFDAARYEVAAQKWARLVDENYSVAVLNDCKYGYDVRGDTIRITLIKSATYPDPQADQGLHTFTYSFLPLPDADRALLDREAYDLNVPLVIAGPTGSNDFAECRLVSSSNKATIIETLKPAEDGNGFILRLFEANGQPAGTTLTFDQSIALAQRVDFLEQFTCECAWHGNSITLDVQPFEIVSLRVVLAA
ncbi:MAG: glycoside hydrolase family 38 C-terminal domain-containing protein [Pseudomonadota bacterium]